MAGSRDKLLTLALRQTPVILFVVTFIIFGILSPRFFSAKNFENIVKQASYIGIVAVGMTFVLLTAGIDLSAIAAGLLIQNYNVPVRLSLAVCLLVGLGFGAVNAFCITKLKIIPFITTLGTLFAGVGNVFPGTVLGTVLIQMISAGLVFTQVDLYIQPLIEGAIIFFAVLLDSFRNTQLLRLGRRHIRVEQPA